jgi:hypothetical protein
MAGKARRHVLTYADTFAPGEGRPLPLPAAMRAGAWQAFRLATGPVGEQVMARIGVDRSPRSWEIRVNGVAAQWRGEVKRRPGPDLPLYEFSVPAGAIQRGETVVDVRAEEAGVVHWVELSFADIGT